MGALDEDDWNEEHGYTDRRVYHKSKNSESFKKYIQHLMHNDNLSLYDGVVLLCKIIPDNNQREMIVGMKDEPLLVNKDNFNELQNKLGYDDATNIVNALFGDWDGFYDWMRDNNKW